MNKTVESAAEDVAADLNALKRDVAGMAEAMGKLLQRESHGFGSRVSGAVESVTDKMEGTAVNAQQRLYAAGRAVDAGIERNALTAVLISFAVGVSIGLLSRLRA